MIGRNKEFKFVRDGFLNNGSLRCAITLSPYGGGKSSFLNEVKSSLASIEKKSLIIAPLSTNCTDLNSLLSSMVRDISLGQ
jgi:reverse gyrase